MTTSKKQLSKVMSDLGKISAKKNKHRLTPEYMRALQAKGVKTRLENKKKTGKY